MEINGLNEHSTNKSGICYRVRERESVHLSPHIDYNPFIFYQSLIDLLVFKALVTTGNCSFSVGVLFFFLENPMQFVFYLCA